MTDQKTIPGKPIEPIKKNEVVLSKNITPTTKRIAIGGMIALAMTSLIIAGLGKIDFKDALFVVIPAMTTISAWVDGGR